MQQMRQFKRWHAWVAGVPVYEPGASCRAGFVLSGNNLGGDFSAKERLAYSRGNGFPIPPVGRIEGDMDQRGSWGESTRVG